MQVSIHHHGQLAAPPDWEPLLRDTPLPSRLPELPGHDLDAQYGSTRIGGDFFDVLASPERLVLMLTDIAGERTDAHRLAVEAQEAFRNTGIPLLTPGANDADNIVVTLHEINRALMSAAQGVRCAPTFLAAYEVGSGVLTYINAGSGPAVMRASGETVMLASSGLPLGLFTHLTHDAQFTVLPEGGSLTLVSKGIVEARRHHEEFGIHRVADIASDPRLSAVERNRRILREAMTFGQPKAHAGFFGPSLHIPGFKRDDDEQDMTVFTLRRS